MPHRMTTDMLPRGMSEPNSTCQRSARAPRTSGSSSNHDPIPAPNRAVRRWRTPSSRTGTDNGPARGASGDEDELSADVAGLADAVGLGGALEREGLHLDHQLVLRQQLGDL